MKQRWVLLFVASVLIILPAFVYILFPGVQIEVNRGIDMLHYKDSMGLCIQMNGLGNKAGWLAWLLPMIQVLFPPFAGNTVWQGASYVLGWGPAVALIWLGMATASMLIYILTRLIMELLPLSRSERYAVIVHAQHRQAWWALLLLSALPGWGPAATSALGGVLLYSVLDYLAISFLGQAAGLTMILYGAESIGSEMATSWLVGIIMFAAIFWFWRFKPVKQDDSPEPLRRRDRRSKGVKTNGKKSKKQKKQ